MRRCGNKTNRRIYQRGVARTASDRAQDGKKASYVAMDGNSGNLGVKRNYTTKMRVALVRVIKGGMSPL